MYCVVETEMREGVTHVGTLSVLLAWRRDAVMDVGPELLIVHTESFAGCLIEWSTDLKENNVQATVA